MPTYDFKESKRGIETERLRPNKFIIFEGILAFHDQRIRDLMDLKIYVDLDADIRLSRRIYRDIIERGREMHNVIGRYHKFVKPAYETYIHPTRKYADIIIPRGGENTNAIDLIAQYLKGLIEVSKERKGGDGFEKIGRDDIEKLFVEENEDGKEEWDGKCN